MAKKTNRKLSLKKETLRTLNAQQLQGVVGGGQSGPYCTLGNRSLGCGSVTDGCVTETIRIGEGEQGGG
ncbi:MAG TPA: class I lanthipeptide [Kofleriaceae bacterium]|jgi:hypothetical protein